MSFRCKIAVTIICVVAVVIFTVLGTSFFYLQQGLREELHHSNEILIQSLMQHTAIEAMLKEEYGPLQLELEDIARQTSIETIVLMDADNRVLASSDFRLIGQQSSTNPSGPQWYVLDITSGAASLGKIAYNDSGARVQAALTRALRFGIAVAVVGIVIVALVGVFIGSMLAQRLERIASTTQRISEGEPEDITVDNARDEVGQLSRFIQHLVHEQYEHLSELELNRERMRLALDVGGIATWSWHYVKKKITWSAKFYQSLGILPDSVKPSYKLWISRIHPEDRTHVEKAVAQTFRNYLDLDIEFRIIRANGNVRWMQNIARIQFDHDGNPIEVYGLQTDITRFKNLSKQEIIS